MERLVVTDSTADLPKELIKKYGIKVIPVNVILDGKTYKDGVDISRESFYSRFDDYREMSTEPIRYEDYALQFMQMVKNYREIIIIHCSSHLSKNHSVAVQVNKEFNGDGTCRVEVIEHLERPLWGVQFHPERSGSSGRQLAANFARIVPP